MSNEMQEPAKDESPKIYTKEALRVFLSEIEEKLVNSESAPIHSLVAINHLLCLPNIEELLDEETRVQFRDLWIKLKATGLQLADPPLIFGLPEDFEQYAQVVANEIADDEEILLEDKKNVVEKEEDESALEEEAETEE